MYVPCPTSLFFLLIREPYPSSNRQTDFADFPSLHFCRTSQRSNATHLAPDVYYFNFQIRRLHPTEASRWSALASTPTIFAAPHTWLSSLVALIVVHQLQSLQMPDSPVTSCANIGNEEDRNQRFPGHEVQWRLTWIVVA
jgi:hypothetical protein